MATMGAFWEKASIYLNLPKITMTDVVEILIITFLFYAEDFFTDGLCGLRTQGHGYC